MSLSCRDQRPNVCEPGPCLTGEGEVGIERECFIRPVRVLDIELHADCVRPSEGGSTGGPDLSGGVW